MNVLRRIALTIGFSCVTLLPAVGASAAAGAVKHVNCEGRDQIYLWYSPTQDKAALLPAVLLLHGAGDQPSNMIDAWQRLANKKQIILLAPDLPRETSYEEAAPAIFRCIVEDAKPTLHIDPRRVYIFGNSMGGYLAYDAAMFDSQYFAAVAVHAMRIAEDYVGIVNHAQRKTPIAIYIGDHDQFFSANSVRKTRDLLLRAGFSVHYVEMIQHDHDYYARSDEINSDAWKFFGRNSLSLTPN